MRRKFALLTLALAATGCVSRIELPGTVLPPQQAAVAVEGMGAPVEWRGVDAATGQIMQIAAFERLAEDFPNSSSVRLRLLNARVQAGALGEAYEDIVWLTDRDYQFSEEAERELIALFPVDWARRIGPRLGNAVQPVSPSQLSASAPATIRLPETILHDENTGRSFVSSIVSKALFAGEGNGDFRSLPLGSTGSITGMALDAPRGLIWVASTIMEQTPDPQGAFNGLIAIDRETLVERRRVPAPNGAVLGDIAVGPDGAVYAGDPVNGFIWVAGPTAAAVQSFIGPGTFRSPQGIAVRPDNSALYVSDYRYGLAQVMLRSRAVYRMRAGEPMLLDGVDGLWLRGNELIAVQNGVSPHRITAFQLGQGVGVIASHRVLEMDNPEWTEPLGGSISGDALHYIGNGQWDIWGEGGAVNEGASARATQIRRLPLVQTPAEAP